MYIKELKKILDIEIKNSNDELKYFLGKVIAVKNRKNTYFILSVNDEKEIEKIQEKLEKLALFDHLTDLKNRRFLYESYEIEASKHRRNKTYGALIFLDLNSFKQINDMYGHIAGDEVLKEVGKRIKNKLRKNDIPCRYGGDEFVILADLNETDRTRAAQKAETVALKIISAFNEPIKVIHDEFQVSISIGISLFGGGEDIESIDNLIKYADEAMYRSKRTGKNIITFSDSQIQNTITKKMVLLKELEKAIKEKEIILFFQPQVDNEGNVIGAEALARWIKDGKIIPPGQFIPLAEETGLIEEIGYIVLEKSILTLKDLQQDEKTKNWKISVNASSKQLERDDFFEEMKNLIKIYEIPTSKLVLEVTESIFIDNLNKIVKKLKELQNLGVHISIDDFGTGYSSLSYIKNLPVNELKIDKSFIDEILDNRSLAIVKTILTLSKELDYEVVVEGVESKEQYEILKELGGKQFFQGYLFAKPMPLNELKNFQI